MAWFVCPGRSFPVECVLVYRSVSAPVAAEERAMADSDGGGRKWLRCGCIGCLAVVVFVVLTAVVIFSVARVGVNSEQVAEVVFEPQIPVTDIAEVRQQGKPGRVVLRLSGGEFYIKPAQKGESLHVEAQYDQNGFELRERFDPGEERWTYEVDFERKGGMAMAMLRRVLGGTGSRVEVFLPTDVPLELEVLMQQGGAEMDLGGLWLTDADIEFAQGGFVLQISEPLREPMDSLAIHGSMAGLAAMRLGDASPRRLDVECSMGGMELDLRGNWVVDSEITVRLTQGGGEMRLPRDVEIVGLETSRVRPHGDEETPRPTLTFTTSSSRGELEIVE